MERTGDKIDVTGIRIVGEASNFTAFVSKLTINETSKTKYDSQYIMTENTEDRSQLTSSNCNNKYVEGFSKYLRRGINNHVDKPSRRVHFENKR
jgi:hypothetical protein